MKTYRIENQTSGVVLGDYQGEDEQAAIEAMYHDAGYPYHDTGSVPGTSDDLAVTEIGCPRRRITINRESIGLSEWAGSGLVTEAGTIYDCEADLGEDVYDAIKAQIEAGLDAGETHGYSWAIEELS